MSDRDEGWSIDAQGGSRSGEATSDGKGWRKRGRDERTSEREETARKLKGEQWSGRH